MITSLRPMSMAEVLDRAFQAYRRHFTTMFIVAVVTFVPFGLLYMMAGEPVTGRGGGDIGPVFLTLALLALPVTAVGWAALAKVAHDGAVGEVPRVGPSLRRGLRLVVRLLLFGVMVYVMLLVAMLAMVLPAGLAMGAGMVGVEEGSTAMLAVVALAGLVALAVGAVVLTWWGAVATLGLPIMVVEDVGALKAFRRAHTLSSGARVRVVALGFVAWLAVMLPTLGLLIAFGVGSSFWDPSSAATMTATEVYLENALLSLTGVLTTPFVVSSMVFIYLDRRVRREGYDVELASAALASGD